MVPGNRQLPPPLTVPQRDVVSQSPTATNSGTDIYDTAAVGSVSVTSLWGTVKGMPLRGGCFLTSLGILEQPSRHPLCAAPGLSSRSGCSRGAAFLFPAKFFRLLLDGWDCRRDRYLYRILTSNAELAVFVW